MSAPGTGLPPECDPLALRLYAMDADMMRGALELVVSHLVYRHPGVAEEVARVMEGAPELFERGEAAALAIRLHQCLRDANEARRRSARPPE